MFRFLFATTKLARRPEHAGLGSGGEPLARAGLVTGGGRAEDIPGLP